MGVRARATCAAMRSSSASSGGTLVYRNDDSHTVVDQSARSAPRTLARGVRSVSSTRTTCSCRTATCSARTRRANTSTLRYSCPLVLTPGRRCRINGRRLISQAFRDQLQREPAALIFDLPADVHASPVIATGFESGPSPFTSPARHVRRGDHGDWQSRVPPIEPDRRLPRAARRFGLDRAIHRGRHQADGVLRIRPLGRTRGALSGRRQLLLCDFAQFWRRRSSSACATACYTTLAQKSVAHRRGPQLPRRAAACRHDDHGAHRRPGVRLVG